MCTIDGESADPVYAPRPRPSSVEMICMQRTFGQPVMVPPGNSARSASIGERSARKVPRTFDTM